MISRAVETCLDIHDHFNNTHTLACTLGFFFMPRQLVTRVGLRSGVDLPVARYSEENIGNDGGRLGKALQV